MSEPVRVSVAVLADDLIWASRLVAAVRNAGAEPLPARNAEALADLLRDGHAAAVIVDLNGRSYDGVAALARSVDSGRPTVGVGQHEDLDTRRRALDAGASQVYSYNRFFREGAKLVGRLLDATAAGTLR